MIASSFGGVSFSLIPSLPWPLRSPHYSFTFIISLASHCSANLFSFFHISLSPKPNAGAASRSIYLDNVNIFPPRKKQNRNNARLVSEVHAKVRLYLRSYEIMWKKNHRELLFRELHLTYWKYFQIDFYKVLLFFLKFEQNLQGMELERRSPEKNYEKLSMNYGG